VEDAQYVVVRGAAVSIGVDPGGSECGGLVDELLQAGYIQSSPSPSLTAHGLLQRHPTLDNTDRLERG